MRAPVAAAPAVVALPDEGLGNSSYLVDLGGGRALVVDPSRDPLPTLEAATGRGLTVAVSADTHLHADFVSGSRELAAAGAEVVAPAGAHLAWPARGLAPGDELDLGGLRLRALPTPGHTPEHLAYLLLDGERPAALFSGGSLLVGAVARTDLVDPDETEELARRLWRSLHEHVLTLPDDLPVYPTHGAGSFCAAPAGAERVTTIGREKAGNALLGAPDEDAFVRRLLAGLGSYPPYFLRLREVNRRGARVYGGLPALAPLSPDDVVRLQAGGAWVVDARPVAAVAAGYVPGSVAIPLRAAFATWLGWVVPDDRPLVFVLDAGQDRADLVRQALKVGYEHLAGELAGGMEAWRASGQAVATLPLVPVARVEGPLLDVRQAGEFEADHVPGATHVELGALAGAPQDLPPGPLVVMCGHGERAVTAASLLARSGRTDVAVATGGPGDWRAAREHAG